MNKLQEFCRDQIPDLPSLMKVAIQFYKRGSSVLRGDISPDAKTMGFRRLLRTLNMICDIWVTLEQNKDIMEGPDFPRSFDHAIQGIAEIGFMKNNDRNSLLAALVRYHLFANQAFDIKSGKEEEKLLIYPAALPMCEMSKHDSDYYGAEDIRDMARFVLGLQTVSR